ncbi:MAG: hypothetical protein AAGC55_02445 [Myxococcota bacterium]
MERFQRLGEAIRDRWSEFAFDHHKLPTIAGAALTEMAISDVRARDILRWVRTSDELPAQEDLDARFGQPPVTLYGHPEFFISAHFWHSRESSIHGHSFTGAFMVIEGAELQKRYAFQCLRKVDDRLQIGQVRFLGAEVLEPGQVQPILGGGRFIHAIAPLHLPTVSLVVRTRKDCELGPQYMYMPPHVSFDPFADKSDPVHRRRLQCLALLGNIDAADYEDAAVETIRNASAYTGWCVLLQAVPSHNRGQIDLTRLVEIMHECHGAWVEALMPSLRRAEVMQLVASRRSRLATPDQRFFLSVLGGVRERRDILRLIAAWIPERDPRDTVMDWVAALSGTELVGIDFDELNTAIFRYLLDGVSPDEIPARLAESCHPDDIARQRQDLDRHIDRIQRAQLFEHLLA